LPINQTWYGKTQCIFEFSITKLVKLTYFDFYCRKKVFICISISISIALALCASFVYSLLIYLPQAIYDKQVQNCHAEDIIVIHIILTELFFLRLLQNTAPAYQPLLCPYIHYFITSTLYWRKECSFPSYGMQQTPWLGTTLKTEKRRILNWDKIYSFWKVI